jgi:hypothetical protein
MFSIAGNSTRILGKPGALGFFERSPQLRKQIEQILVRGKASDGAGECAQRAAFPAQPL